MTSIAMSFAFKLKMVCSAQQVEMPDTFCWCNKEQDPFPLRTGGQCLPACMARPQQLQCRIRVANVVQYARSNACSNKRNNAALMMHSRLHVAIVKAAEAEAEAKFLQGQGIARQRAAVVAGLRESCAEFTNQSDIQSKDGEKRRDASFAWELAVASLLCNAASNHLQPVLNNLLCVTKDELTLHLFRDGSVVRLRENFVVFHLFLPPLPPVSPHPCLKFVTVGTQGVGPGNRQNSCQNGVLRKLPPGLPDLQQWLGTLPGAYSGGVWGAGAGFQEIAHY
eukprot:165004-Pelagomonas_calceolata.AAC.2